MGDVTSRTGSIAKLMTMLRDIPPWLAVIELLLVSAGIVGSGSGAFATP